MQRKTPDKTNTRSKSSRQKSSKSKIPRHSQAASKGKAASTNLKKNNTFPIVGIGASAGGLEAIEKFFSHMPHDCGMAFVLVVHLAADKKSIMDDLLKKFTKMNVYQIEDKVEIKPDCIYITAPNKEIAILQGKLHLMVPTERHGLRLPIDYFFRSLADERSEKAICIVLSGTGTDGTLGVKAVKGNGGLAIVQEEKSAKYDGMPRSAISTGVVDYILPVEDMPENIIKYVKHSYIKSEDTFNAILPKTTDYLDRIYILLRNHTGHDFSGYKKNTICRRIEKRLAVHMIDSMSSYVDYLQKNKNELDTLFKELLIGVTNFFRDPEAFEVIEKKILPELLENKLPSQSLRLWVPGCSTGEEAYSLAILLHELCEKTKVHCDVQIFATDIDNDAIETARKGIFPDGIAADIAPERLKRYFIKEKTVYYIKKNIREMIVFAAQDIIKDPPFSKLDFISCRNLLIYLDADMQKKLLPLFHYTLNPNGFLVLGSSETIGRFSDLYSVTNNKWKIYKKKLIVSRERPVLDFPNGLYSDESVLNRDGVKNAIKEDISLRELTEKIIIEDLSPPCVVINQKNDIIYIHGKTGKYLEPVTGDMNVNIFEMARRGLKLPLSNAIRNARMQKGEIVSENIRVEENGGYNIVNLIVKPVEKPESYAGLIILVFDDITTESKEDNKNGIENTPLEIQTIHNLEQELKSTKEYLQTTIEELETTNEELNSTNEELQSSIEEFQSTNEELETSKEELQSVNEELVTVNAELENKITELTITNNDMNNLLASTEIATIFLDNNLNIQRYTPSVTNIINIIQSDIGRPLNHLVTNFHYDTMLSDASKVIETLVSKEVEVQSKNNDSYILRMIPYRTTENVIDGLVITFINITEHKEAAESLKDERVLAKNIVETIREPLLILDSEMNVNSANSAFYQMFKVTSQETEGEFIFDLGNHQWDIPELRRLLVDVLPHKKTIEHYELKADFPHIGQRVMLLNARQIVRKKGSKKFILLAIEDITKHMK
ncbi:chemotaxis protein CheB [Candidatus Omnitrophota bacterium]